MDLYLKDTADMEIYKPGSDLASEAKLFLYQNKLLKIFSKNTDIFNKRYIIEQLLKNKKYINISGLVLPEEKVFLKSYFSGYSMPFYSNCENISDILFTPKYSMAFKLFILKEVLKIILQVEQIPKLKDNFFLGDIYGNNFIWDKDACVVRAVDMDGIYINGSKAQVAFHLGLNSPFVSMQKYPKDQSNGRIIFNHNTSIACFGIMLINTFAGTFIPYWENSHFWAYLNYLATCGIPNEVLEHLASIYLEKEPNDFYPELLDQINPNSIVRYLCY